MGLFNSILESGLSDVIDSTGKAIDSITTSDDERNKAKITLEKNMQSFKLDMETRANEFEKEITKRWESDSEHTITRLVRPISYMFILALFALMVLFDGNLGNIHIVQAYIPVIQTLLVTMTVAYFGSRGYEKVTKLKGK